MYMLYIVICYIILLYMYMYMYIYYISPEGQERCLAGMLGRGLLVDTGIKGGSEATPRSVSPFYQGHRAKDGRELRV